MTSVRGQIHVASIRAAYRDDRGVPGSVEESELSSVLRTIRQALLGVGP